VSPRPAARTSDVLIVGGGVAGCASAWALARAGLSVRLLERGDLAGATSGAAAGMLAPYAEVRRDSPLAEIGCASLARFPELCDALRAASGIDPELEITGSLRLARSVAEADALRGDLAHLRHVLPGGPAVEWIEGEDVRRIEPALAGDWQGGLHTRAEAHVRPPQLTRAFAGAAVAAGATIERGVAVGGLLRRAARIHGVRSSEGEFEAGCVVLATGCWIADLGPWLRELGLEAPRVPVEPVRGQIVALDPLRPSLRGTVWGGGLYLVPKRDGQVIVGATEERVGFDCRVTAEGVGGLLAAVPGVVPELASAGFSRAWAGLRPTTPDGLPGIGRLPGLDGLVLAVGHSRNGVLLAPITAERVVAAVTGRAVGDAFDAALDPTRWLGASPSPRPGAAPSPSA